MCLKSENQTHMADRTAPVRGGVRLRGSRVRVEGEDRKWGGGGVVVVYKLPNSSFLLLQSMVGAFLADRF